MAKIIIPNIEIKSDMCWFKIDLLEPVVCVSGDSGTGKSRFVNRLKLEAEFGEYKDQPIICINELTKDEEVDLILRCKENSLLVIDNADTILLHHNILNEKDLLKDSNQYLLMSRAGFRYGAPMKAWANMVYADRIYTLDYPFR